MPDIRLSNERNKGDTQGRQERVATYIVTDVPPEAIPITPGAAPLVDLNRGVTLPVPGMNVGGRIVESVEPADLGNGRGSLVSVYFGTRFGTINPPAPDRPEYAKVIPSFRDVVVSLPHQILTRETKRENGSALIFDAYEIIDFQLTETRDILRGRVSVPTLTVTDRTAIRGQINRLHTIGGNVYRFTGAQTVPNQDRIDVFYEWEFDAGTPISPISLPDVYTPSDAAAVGNIAIGGINPVPPSGLCRSPYAQLVIRPAEDLGDPHSYRQLFNYVETPLGWQLLPSIGQLAL